MVNGPAEAAVWAWLGCSGRLPAFPSWKTVISSLFWSLGRSLEITRNMSGEALRSPGTSALVHFLFHQPSLLPFKHLTLGLSFKTCIFHEVRRLPSHTESRRTPKLAVFLSSAPGIRSFWNPLPLLYWSHMANRKISVSVYELSSNSVTSVDLGSHLETLSTLGLFWDRDDLSWCGRVRTLGVMCLAPSRCSIPELSWVPSSVLFTDSRVNCALRNCLCLLSQTAT